MESKIEKYMDPISTLIYGGGGGVAKKKKKKSYSKIPNENKKKPDIPAGPTGVLHLMETRPDLVIAEISSLTMFLGRRKPGIP